MDGDEEIIALVGRLRAIEDLQARSFRKGRVERSLIHRATSSLAVMRDQYSQWSYENPQKGQLAGWAGGASSFVLLLLLVWGVAGTGVGQVVGLATLKDRVSNAYYAVLWGSRGQSNTASDLPIVPERLSGSIERVVGDILVVIVYQGDAGHRRLVRLANVSVTDKAKFAEWVQPYLLKGLTFDFYKVLGSQSGHDVWGAVLWSARIPLNVEPVERGIGFPEKNPPTTVVNQIFSQYYWSLAKG